MKGVVKVTGNKKTDGLAHNVFLNSGKFIDFSDGNELDANSRIGISLNQTVGEFTRGWHGRDGYADIFSPDQPNVVRLGINSEGEVHLLYNNNPEGNVYYIERGWDDTNKNVTAIEKTLYNGDYTLLGNAQAADYHLTGGNYVVKGHFTVNGFLYVEDDCNIILCDEATLTVVKCMEITKQKGKLNIFGQTYDSGLLEVKSEVNKETETHPGIGPSEGTNLTEINFHGGIINVISDFGYSQPGIGGAAGTKDFGTINFYGGTVKAQGLKAPAIGAGLKTTYGKINFYGGTIDAESLITAAAIGCGLLGEGDESDMIININSGDITASVAGGYASLSAGIGGAFGASGKTVTINGGIVRAYGGVQGPGIGGGVYGKDAGKLVVNGGQVFATGGYRAAGIGGGLNCGGGTVEINGGYVVAQGGREDGAGIGGGKDGKGCNVKITGGTVITMAAKQGEPGNRAIGPGNGSDEYGSLEIGDGMMVQAGNDGENYERTFTAPSRVAACWFRSSARIEPCTHNGATYTVSGTTVDDTHTKHCSHCLTRFEPEKHNFADGKCTVCGVETETKVVRIYLPEENNGYDGITYARQTTYNMVPGSVFALPESPTVVPGLEFAGWLATTEVTDETYTSSYTTSGETLLPANEEYTISGDVSFVARYKLIDITLLDDDSKADESNLEKLHKHSGMTASSVTLSGRTLHKDGKWNTLCLPFDVEDFTGTPLEGATVKTLDGASFDIVSGKLTLYFSNNLDAIEAGQPYIIRWDDTGNDITDPVFSNTTIKTIEPEAVSVGNTVKFSGIYGSVKLEADGQALYLGADSKILFPNDATSVNALRAYFQITASHIGDVNIDGQVNVTDVTLLVDYLLGKENAGFIVKNADVNGDGEINVTDVTALVNIILLSNQGLMYVWRSLVPTASPSVVVEAVRPD